jgi:hypothetical protein
VKVIKIMIGFEKEVSRRKRREREGKREAEIDELEKNMIMEENYGALK